MVMISKGDVHDEGEGGMIITTVMRTVRIISRVRVVCVNMYRSQETCSLLGDI